MKKLLTTFFLTLLLPLGLWAQKYNYGMDPQRDSIAVKTIRAKMDSIKRIRPTVALVLSGGGAKGAAHVGVLKYLEEIGMPIDIVLGTSMGGLVGGMYSVGHSADFIDSMIRKIDWQMALSDRVPVKYTPYSKKMYKRHYNLSIPFYYARDEFEKQKDIDKHGHGLVHQLTDNFHLGVEPDKKSKQLLTKDNIRTSLPSGFVYGQNVNNLLSSLTVGYHEEMPFWNLPIPFVCVATDFVTSKEKVWYSGSLNTALRSTMAIPGLFTPVRMNGMVLLDGGMKNNYPTDIAKNLGADYVIGVDLSSGYKDYDEIQNLMDIIIQGIDMFGRDSYEANLPKTDVSINPDVTGYTIMSFDPESISALIDRGWQAAESQAALLDSIKTKVGSATTVLQDKTALDLSSGKVKFSEIEFSGIDKNSENYISSRLKFHKGDSLSSREIEQLVGRIYATRTFDSVSYEVIGKEEPYKLRLNCKKGPINQIGIGVRADSDEIVAVLLNLGFNVHSLSGHAVEFTGKLGTNPYAKLHYYYRTISGPAINLASSIKYIERTNFSFGKDLINTTHLNQRNEIYLSNIKWISLDINAGARLDVYHLGKMMANTPNVDKNQFNFKRNTFASLFLDGNADTFDNWYFPSKGFSLSAKYSWVFAGLKDKISPFHTLQLDFKTVANLGKRVSLLPFANVRLIFGDEVPTPYGNIAGGRLAGRYLDQQIPFMGITNASGFERLLFIAGAELRTKIYKNNYISAIVNVGDSASKFKDFTTKADSIFYGYGLEYSYNSILGPIRADIQWSDVTKSVGFYIGLGLDF